MSPVLRALVLLVLPATMSACGGGAGDRADAGLALDAGPATDAARAARLEAADYFAAVAATYCARAAECCTPAELSAGSFGNYSDEAGCLDAVLGGLYAYDAFEPAVEAGTATFDPVAAAACVTSLRDAPCATWRHIAGDGLEFAGVCADVVTGTLADGERCTESHQCVGGNCMYAAEASEPTCHSPKRAGDPCVEHEICLEGVLWCSVEAGLVCVETKPTGAACASWVECADRNCEDLGAGMACTPPSTCDGV